MNAVPTSIPGTAPPSGASHRSAASVDAAAVGKPELAIVESTPARDDVSSRTQVHAGAPRPITASPAARSATPASAVPTVRAASRPIVAAESDDIVEMEMELELAEPTDFSLAPPETTGEPTDAAASQPASPPDVTVPRTDAAAAQPASELRPRKTALGIAVGPPGIAVEPDETTDRSLLAAEETTGPDPIRVGDGAIDAEDPARPPALQASTPLEEETPLEIWRVPPGAVVPAHAVRSADPAASDAMDPDAATSPGAPVPAPPLAGDPVAAAMPGAVLPSGDWTIALDPAAPDGWSAPFPAVAAPDPAADPAARARQPVNAFRPRPARARDELPAAEPKVQIDPTLIEPLRPMASEPPYSAHGSMPGVYPSPYGAPTHANEAPAYAMAPGYQMVPVAPGVAPGGVPRVGFVDPRYAGDTEVRVPRSQRRAVIVLISAAVAVVIGIVLVAVLTGQRDPAAPHGGAPNREPPHLAPHPAAKPASTEPSGGHATTAPGDPAAAGRVATAPSPGKEPCFANVSSTPTGAEIVIDQTTVIGTTPQTVSLPCGAEVELMVRKARLLPVTRTVTPTPAGVKIRVALTKQAAVVKVSSTPEGATITLNGKAMGVTPTTIKVPALESSTLIITKTGYETEAEKVSPKSTGATVHIQLHRLDRAPR